MQGRNGFTLVELLVSLLIFAMLAAAGVALLTFSVRAQEVAEVRLDDLAALRRAGSLLSADLAQAAPRPSRDEAGAVRPAFEGGSGEGDGLLLVFVRRGWENYDESPRPSLQKVEYRLAGAKLLRRSYPRVDGSAAEAEIVLIDGIGRIRLRYRTRRGEWRDRWDPVRGAELPRAVELVADVEGGGVTRQLFLTGTGA